MKCKINKFLLVIVTILSSMVGLSGCGDTSDPVVINLEAVGWSQNGGGPHSGMWNCSKYATAFIYASKQNVGLREGQLNTYRGGGNGDFTGLGDISPQPVNSSRQWIWANAQTGAGGVHNINWISAHLNAIGISTNFYTVATGQIRSGDVLQVSETILGVRNWHFVVVTRANNGGIYNTNTGVVSGIDYYNPWDGTIRAGSRILHVNNNGRITRALHTSGVPLQP